MTLYEKELEKLIESHFGELSPTLVGRKLVEMGLIDHTAMKVLVIREFVKEQVLAGVSKLSAMWTATEMFACSYEYVRKCLYYYKDVNLVPVGAKSV